MNLFSIFYIYKEYVACGYFNNVKILEFLVNIFPTSSILLRIATLIKVKLERKAKDSPES